MVIPHCNVTLILQSTIVTSNKNQHIKKAGKLVRLKLNISDELTMQVNKF